MSKSLRTVLVSAVLGISQLAVAQAYMEPELGQVAISVAKLLQQGQYNQQFLDDAMAQRVFDRYLEDLDYSKLFFTQADVDGFRQKYATELDNDVLRGDLDPAFEIYDLYEKRVSDRVEWIKQMVGKDFDFSSDRKVVLDRKDVPRPKDLAEADQLWKDRIEGELLTEKLNKISENKDEKDKKDGSDAKKDKAEASEVVAKTTPVEIVTRRYNQLLRNVKERERADQAEIFLNSLATTYDPHSEYMGQSQLDSFNIHMKLSLVGIGAVLKSEEGYAKIAELVVGGPADRDGRLKVGDRVAAVGQGKEPLVDTVDMKLDKVVEKIRGKKGTTVRLQIIPANSDLSKRKLVDIVREEVHLKDQEAKAELIDHKNPDGKTEKLGWITLPSFYADMGGKKTNTSKSTTRDVAALLQRLQKEGIDGLVIDLRRDGGGSLEEAVNMTGLFITDGPVVQYQTANGGKFVLDDKDSSVAYGGPLIVLTNKLSASASEIFTAALQDYGRAVVVGDSSTFGKGTVQTMLDIDDFMSLLTPGEGAGALKLTIQKFYRVSGGSTQLRGVLSDILLPSITDTPKVGEVALENPLPYDEIDPKRIDRPDNERPLFLEELRRRSGDRVVHDPEFRYVLEDIERMRQQLKDNEISLNEKARRTEITEADARKAARSAARKLLPQNGDKVYSLTLDDVNKSELALASSLPKKPSALEDDGDSADDAEPEIDPIRSETLNILNDLIDLSRAPRTASTIK